jgi:hypothetical protein
MSTKKKEEKKEDKKPEKLAYSKQLGESLSKKSRAEDSLKSFQIQAKSDIASLEANINSLADKINTGREYRPVDCEIRYDYKAKERHAVRMDTGEIAISCPITEEELQEKIDL